MTTLTTRQLAWTGPTGVAEASDLGWGTYPRNVLLQYSDAGAVVCRLEHQEVDIEGDLLFTRYVGTRAVRGAVPVLVVFND